MGFFEDDGNNGDIQTADQSHLYSDNELKDMCQLVQLYISAGCRTKNNAAITISTENEVCPCAVCITLFLKVIPKFEIPYNPLVASSTVVDLLKHGISNLAIDPFRKWIAEGKAQEWVSRLPQYVNLMGHYDHYKLV